MLAKVTGIGRDTPAEEEAAGTHDDLVMDGRKPERPAMRGGMERGRPTR
jgi:hypothetical protein